jgi:TIR domain
VEPALRGVAFISYVREDSRRVDRLEKFLKANGVPVWRDTHDLRPGEDWHAKIREAIDADSLAFVACFSKNSEARQRSYQRDELLLAIQQFRMRPPESPYILPIRFDDCTIPDLDIGAGRTLNSLHHVDLFGRQWQASAERLLEGIRHVLSPAPETRRWRRRSGKPQSGTPAPVADGSQWRDHRGSIRSLSPVKLVLAGLASLAVITLAAVGVFRLVDNGSPGVTGSGSTSGSHSGSTSGSHSGSTSGSHSGSASGSPTPQSGVRVTDNSGAVSAVVPQSWGVVVGNGWHPHVPGSFNGSFIGPGFNATTNLGNWFDDLTTPGIFVGASKLLIAEHYNPVTALGTFAPSCNFFSSEPVTADGLTGYRDMWTCQNSTTRYETIAMWPKGHSFIAYIELKIVTPVDEADGNRVLATLSIRY